MTELNQMTKKQRAELLTNLLEKMDVAEVSKVIYGGWGWLPVIDLIRSLQRREKRGRNKPIRADSF